MLSSNRSPFLSLTFAVGILVPTTNACTHTEAATETSSTDSIEPADPNLPRFALGPLSDDDIAQVAWQALDTRLAKTETLPNDAEETVELGDRQSFRYTIVQVTRAGDDVSSDKPEPADGLALEVTGWLKKTRHEPGDDKPAACFSFDTTLPLRLREGRWSVPDDLKVALGREDAEDCY